MGYSATISYNYFRDGEFTFVAWKAIPLRDIHISDGHAVTYQWQTSRNQPFLKLNDENPVHMLTIKEIGLQINGMYSYQWTEHTSGVPYSFTTLVAGLVYERDLKGPESSPIRQWRIFVIAK